MSRTPPYHWSRTTKRTVLIAGIGLAGILVYLAWFLIPIVATAMVLAYLLMPPVDWLCRRRLHRGLATGSVYLLLLLFIIVVPAVGLPALVRSANSIDWHGIVTSLSASVSSALANYHAVEIAGYTVDLSSVIDPLRQRLEAGAVTDLPAVPELLNSLTGWASRALVTVLGFVGTLLLVLVTAFYFTLDAPRITSSLVSYLPPRALPELRVLGRRLSRVWASFFRGELLLGTIIGTLTALGGMLIGLPGALWLGLIAGVLEVVPSIGPVISAVPAVAVALGQGSNAAWLQGIAPPAYALIVVGMYTMIQQLENNFIVPRVIGGAVGLPAVIVLLGAVVGASMFGVLGIFMAAPFLASVGVILRYTHNKLIDRPPLYGMSLDAAERRAAEEAGLLEPAESTPAELPDTGPDDEGPQVEPGRPATKPERRP